MRTNWKGGKKVIIKNTQEPSDYGRTDQHPVTWLGCLFGLLSRAMEFAPKDVGQPTSAEWDEAMRNIEEHILEGPFLNTTTYRKDYKRLKQMLKQLSSITYAQEIEITTEKGE